MQSKIYLQYFMHKTKRQSMWTRSILVRRNSRGLSLNG